MYEGYEAVIRGAEFDGNTLKSVTAKIEHYTGIDAKNIPYAVAAAEMYDADGELSGTYYSGVSSKYDATNGNGVFDLVFESGAEMPEGGSYRICIRGFSSDNTVMGGEDYRISEYFTPDTASNMYMIGSAEDISVPDSFDYYGVRTGADLGGNNGWYLVGSSTRSATLERNGETYAQLTKSSESGSYVVYRAFDSQVSGGRLIIDADLYYESGTMRFVLSNKTSSPNSGYDTRQDCFTIENGRVLDSAQNELGSIAAEEWIHISYVLDMNRGVETLSVGDDMYEYEAEGFDALVPENVTVSALQQLNISGVSSDTLSARITSVSVRSAAEGELPYMTLTLAEPSESEGSVDIADSDGLSVSGVMNSIVEITAVPADGYTFAGWFDENGSLVSGSPLARIRLHRDVELTAVFEPDDDPIEYAYKETFTSLSTQTLAENGWISQNAQSKLTIKNDPDTWQDGSYVYFDPGTSTRNAKVIFPETARLTESYVFEMDFALVNGSGSASEFTIFTDSTEVPDNSSVSGDYILKFVSTSSSKTMPWIINDDIENTVTLEQETRTPIWAHMKLTVDPQSGAAELVITQNGEEKYNGQIIMNVTDGDYSAAGMNFKAVKSYSRCQFDNIRIYSAAQEIQ